MSLADFAAQISFTTRFETDKICGIITDSYNAADYDSVLGGYLYVKAIPHTFIRPVFCDALFSNDGTNFTPNGQVLEDLSASLNVFSDANNIYIMNTANSGTVSYKIVCTWIDNYDPSNPLITPMLIESSTTAKYYFDTRANYQKILLPGEVTLNGTGTQDIEHSLDYAPHYKIFFESLPGQVWPAISGGTQDIWFFDNINQHEIYATINNLNLTLNYNGPNIDFRVWLKIYYDGEVSA